MCLTPSSEVTPIGVMSVTERTWSLEASLLAEISYEPTMSIVG